MNEMTLHLLESMDFATGIQVSNEFQRLANPSLIMSSNYAEAKLEMEQWYIDGRIH